MAHAGLWLLAGVILGSVTGAATATFLGPMQPSAPPQDAAEFGSRVAASMETAFLRAAERVREEADAPSDAPPKAAGETRAHGDVIPEPPRRRPAKQDAVSGSSAKGPALSDGAAGFPPKDTARLERMVARTEEAILSRRRQWMSVDEKVIGEAFGLPDEVVQQKDGRLSWRYDFPHANSDGGQVRHSLSFVFAEGRVVAIEGAEDIPK